MPIKYRKEKSRALDQYCKAELLFGECLLAGVGYHSYQPDPSRDTARMRSDWGRHGEALLAEFVAAHPGERPFAWWLFNAPREPVRQGETVANYLTRHNLLIDADRGRANRARLYLGNVRPNPITDERAG